MAVLFATKAEAVITNEAARLPDAMVTDSGSTAAGLELDKVTAKPALVEVATDAQIGRCYG